MSLRLGDTAPDFSADTTAGPIDFHRWAGESWVVLFSHPRDFTPVCTTELGYMAKLQPEVTRRNVKAVGLNIKETQGFEPAFPIIADPQPDR